MSEDKWLRELLDQLNDLQRETFEERAAIRQYEGGLPRDKAEIEAWKDVISIHPELAAILPSYMNKEICHGQE